MIVVMLMVDFGLAMYEYVAVVNAVREGARYAVANCPPEPPTVGPATCTATAVRDRVVARATTSSKRIITNANEVAVWWCHHGSTTAYPTRGDSVRVAVIHPYEFRFIRIHTFQLGSRIDMNVEKSDTPNSSASVFVAPAGQSCS
jgi:hypothetical protein